MPTEKDVVSLVVQCHDLPTRQLGLGREQRVHGLGGQQTQRCLEAVEEELRLGCLSARREAGMGQGGLSYVVVCGVAVSRNRFPGVIVPDSVGESRTRWRILAVQMADAKLAGPLLVLMDHQ